MARIRSFLALAFTGLAVVPLVLVALILSAQVFSIHLQRALDVEHALAGRVAAQVEAQLRRQINKLRMTARLEPLATLSPERRDQVLSLLLTDESAFIEVGLLDQGGRELARVGPAADALESRGEVPAALASHGEWLGPVRFDQGSGEPSLPMAVVLSDPRTGVPSGLLSALAGWQGVWALIAGLDLGPGAVAFIVDGQHRLVAHADPEVVRHHAVADPQAGIGPGLGGELAVTGLATATVLGQSFTVVIQQPVIQALRPALVGLALTALMLGLALTAAIRLIAVTNRRIIHPIHALAEAARDITAGDLTRRAQAPHDDEIAELARAFNLMTDRSRQLIASLEAEVASRRAAEAATREGERRLRGVVEGSIQGILVHRDMKPLFANQALADIFGLDDPAELVASPSMSMFIAPAERTRVERLAGGRLSGERVRDHYETLGLRRDGRQMWLDVRVTVIDWDGAPAVLASLVDVSERHRAEESLRRLSQVVEQSPAAVAIHGLDGLAVYANPRYLAVTGHALEDVVGVRAFGAGERFATGEGEIWSGVLAGEAWRGESLSRRKDGTPYWELVSVAPLRGGDGAVAQVIVTKEDISLRKSYEERLVRQANYDAVTGLPNRSLAMDRLSHALAQGRRRGTKVGLLFVDLDRFKEVNDTLGHAGGDRLLVQVGERLAALLRAEDTIARAGGDEFIIVIPDMDGAVDCEVVARKVLAALDAPFDVLGVETYIGACIGVTLAPDDGDDAGLLMRNVDGALYQAKERGGSQIQFFTGAFNEQALDRARLDTRLRRALERSEFTVLFQPIVRVADGRYIGAEALLRWHNEELGPVPPDRFIPLAEQTGQIVAIGRWVLETACAEAGRWHAAGRPLRLAVNVSARQVRNGDLPEVVAAVLAETGLPAWALELEITESLLMDDQQAVACLTRLRDLGVRLSVDDFGTGYSSLSYLRRFPVHTVKIDKSFVRGVADRPQEGSLVVAIIAMAHGLDLEVVAEGIEDARELAFIQDQGCDYAQGWHFAKAMPAEEFLLAAAEAESAVAYAI